MKLKWDVAAAHFEPLVEAEKFQVRALCALQLAGCYFLSGQRDKAVAMLQRVPTITKKNSSVDPIVAAQAQRYLASGGHFAAFELLYIRRDLAKMEKEIPHLFNTLEQLAKEVGAINPLAPEALKGGGFLSSKIRSLSLGKTDVVDYVADNRAAYLMIKGAMLRTMNNSDEAIACFKEVISLDNVLREKYFVPYSYFELAETLYHNNQLKEAQDAIKKCNNISGYAWEDPLKVRLRVTMDQLKHGGVLNDDSDNSPSSSVTLIATNGAEPPTPPPPAGKEVAQAPTGVVVEASSS